MTTLGCKAKHTFHSKCIEGWAKVVMNCPFCNIDIQVTSEEKDDLEKGKPLEIQVIEPEIKVV